MHVKAHATAPQEEDDNVSMAGGSSSDSEEGGEQEARPTKLVRTELELTVRAAIR